MMERNKTWRENVTVCNDNLCWRLTLQTGVSSDCKGVGGDRKLMMMRMTVEVQVFCLQTEKMKEGDNKIMTCFLVQVNDQPHKFLADCCPYSLPTMNRS